MKKPIRILHFAYLINCDDFIDVTLKNADPAQYKLMACTMARESNIKEPNLKAYGIPHFILDTQLTKTDFFKTVYKLYQVITEEKVDIIHSHHYYESLIAVLAASFAGKKRVIISRHYHNELYLTTKGLKLAVYLRLEKFVNQYVSAIIAPSTAIVKLLVKQNVNAAKIIRIPYAFDFTSDKYRPLKEKDREAIRNKLKINRNQFVVGNFARHHKIKGQDLLLRMFAEFIKTCKECSLIMVGDGPLHQQLVSLAIELNIERYVLFLGWQKDIRSIMAGVDVVIHPSNQEAFPQIMIEAMALQRPLLITPVSGATDVITDNINGFVIPFRSPEAWAEKLLFIHQNLDRAKAVGENARSTVINTFAIQDVIKKTEDVYMATNKTEP